MFIYNFHGPSAKVNAGAIVGCLQLLLIDEREHLKIKIEPPRISI